eukprot:CAMPEP_0119370638 /NCGR_PEP_ID=MMETSP1334-20130426/16973_1 /TAXON_ID=127549 /ORGANISM="Calcidiscus leptoporus, Strain RCC1130" /LENGTH=325 /DNA_ID=CAMNT_0007387743 /DNA_START=1 /DNA_END=978 /DNA_ORIENTATION=+
MCFTAHGSGELHCPEVPTVGSLALHGEGSVRTIHFESRCNPFLHMGKCAAPKLCETKRCRRCLSPTEEWVPCSKVSAWRVILMAANTDLPPSYAVAFAVALICIPTIVLYAVWPKKRKSTEAEAGKGVALKVALAMLQFAARPWFPWIAALGTAVNLFTLIFTAATVVLYLAAVLGRPHAWRSTAFANAFGATIGSAALLFLLRSQGVEMINEQFPTVFNSPAWAKMMAIMQGYGIAGMVGVAALPLILHPILAFGVLSGMSNTAILAVVLLGRTIKYLVMAYITTTAPTALKYFGISASLFEMAAAAAHPNALQPAGQSDQANN